MDAVHALVYGDLFMRCLYHVRPYELEKGSAEAIHQKWKEICVDSLVNPKTKWRYATSAAASWRTLTRCPSTRRCASRVSALWAKFW